MTDPTNSKVPRIRFKGFAEKWEAKKIESICSISTGKSNTQDRVSDGIYPFYVRSAVVERSNRYLYEEEAVLTVGDGVGTGKVFHYVNGKYDLHQRVYRMHSFAEGVDAVFFYHFFSNHFYKRVMAMTAKTSVDSVRLEMISKMDFRHSSKAEQTKIGGYFCEVDRLIGLQQRKHDKLVTLKKAMLRKMFPQPGATIPEVRFQGFSGEWVKKNLGEAGEFNPREPLPEVFEYVDLESVVGTEMVSHRTETRITAPSRAQRLARRGDLFFQTVRPYQKNNHLYNLADFNFVFSTGYAQIRPFDDGFFLLALMQRDHFVKVVLDHCTGTSYPAINANVLAEIVISVPGPTEQQKIGDYFRTLDELISLHALQLQKLKQLKSGCLEKMFV